MKITIKYKDGPFADTTDEVSEGILDYLRDVIHIAKLGGKLYRAELRDASSGVYEASYVPELLIDLSTIKGT